VETVAREPSAYFTATVARDPGTPEQNEDICLFDEPAGVLAVSDGAGESFDPRRWACILAKSYLLRPDPALTWLGEAVAEYNSGYEREHMSWSAQAAFDRGSFATLLGMHRHGGEVEVLAIGDSLAVLVDRDQFVESFPYRQSSEFARRPSLLGTSIGSNCFLSQRDTSQILTRWNLVGLFSPVIMCMTDALGAWVLERPEERCAQLLEIRDTAGFQALVIDERGAGRLRTDDTTLATFEGW
jgi:Protein phosphatase 2C